MRTVTVHFVDLGSAPNETIPSSMNYFCSTLDDSRAFSGINCYMKIERGEREAKSLNIKKFTQRIHQIQIYQLV